MHQQNPKTLTSLEHHQEITESTQRDQEKACGQFAWVLESKGAAFYWVIRVNPCSTGSCAIVSKTSIGWGSWIRTVATRKCGCGWAAFWIGCAWCHSGAATGATRENKKATTHKREYQTGNNYFEALMNLVKWVYNQTLMKLQIKNLFIYLLVQVILMMMFAILNWFE